MGQRQQPTQFLKVKVLVRNDNKSRLSGHYLLVVTKGLIIIRLILITPPTGHELEPLDENEVLRIAGELKESGNILSYLFFIFLPES